MNLQLPKLLSPISTCSLLMLLLLTNCSSPEEEIPGHLEEMENLSVIQPGTEPSSSIKLVKELAIDNPDGAKAWFHDVSSSGFAFAGADWLAGLEIDDSERIYVGHLPARTIQVFDSTGSYLTKVGREGKGPGEFMGILDIGINANQLYAMDYFQFRTTFFSLDSLKLTKAQNVYLNRYPDIEELTGWLPNRIRLISEDRFLVEYMDEYTNLNVGTPKYNLDKPRPGRYYIVDREGKVLSEMLFELKDQKIITADVGGQHLHNMVPLPFLNQPLISISSGGPIISANSEEPLIKMHSRDGKYLRAFYIPIEKRPLIRDETIQLYDDGDPENQQLLRHAELPEKWPALGTMIMDDESRIWVSTISDSENLMYQWWVLQDTGELLATFRWPENRSIEKIKNGYLYTRETEESTGLQTIVKYRIEMN